MVAASGAKLMNEVRALVCGHVFRNERPVELVVRHSDGEWQCTCGKYDHPSDLSDFEVVGIGHLVDRQSNLVDIGELKPGWMAEIIDGKWIKTQHDD